MSTIPLVRVAAHLRRSGQRSGAAAAVAVWLAALSIAGCGGGGGSSGGSTEPPPAPPPPTDRAGALSASAPGELLAWAQGRLRADPGATAPPVAVDAGAFGTGPVGNPQFVVSAGGAAPPPPPAAVVSGTVLQEPGVDEADVLRSDGQRLFALHAPAALRLQFDAYTRDASGRAQRAGSLALPDADALARSPRGMYLAADTAVVLAQRWQRAAADAAAPGIAVGEPYPGSPARLREAFTVQRIDVADAAAPRATTRLVVDGRLVDSRRIGDRLYLVSRFDPDLPLYALPAGAGATEREASIAALRAADLLPRVSRNGAAAEPLLAETDCWVQRDNASTAVAVTALTVVDLASPALATTSRCFVGGAEAVYMSAQSLYLATTRWTYQGVDARPAGGATTTAIGLYPESVRTDLHKFALGAAGAPEYRGSGSVDGHLGWDPERKPLRLGEHQGDLRVLTFTGREGWFAPADAASKTPSPARLTVLRERVADRTLQTLATLPNASRPEPLGKPGEQIYAVRFVGDRGYVVTFRRTDPLYVLDLSNPADPRSAGALEVPGFSDYLFPLDGGLLLGVGSRADDGGRVDALKVALYDVADAARPRETASLTVGGGGSRWALAQSRHAVGMAVHGGVVRVVRVALPALVLTAGDTSTAAQRALQRVEVDLGARTLALRAAVGAATSPAWADLAGDRSVQIGEQVHYLRDGVLTTHDW